MTLIGLIGTLALSMATFSFVSVGDDECSCVDGEIGPTGATGERGLRGYTGLQGVIGETGERGADYILTDDDMTTIANLVDHTLTDEDISEIAALVDVSDEVVLTDAELIAKIVELDSIQGFSGTIRVPWYDVMALTCERVREYITGGLLDDDFTVNADFRVFFESTLGLNDSPLTENLYMDTIGIELDADTEFGWASTIIMCKSPLDIVYTTIDEYWADASVILEKMFDNDLSAFQAFGDRCPADSDWSTWINAEIANL
ncbi:hypothetical protein KIPB_004419 [Kipferlia bialata]|uniref:Uncharacterized protein n=1 Tax=Kipferlia bialata TaxID=797122 RepID=A0A391NNJ6_9EUKA|nr:hypothetical protein KIPB_004419 [Kipferlia bialata]|eukprot:g4419.t1